MIALQTGQEIELFNILLDACPTMALIGVMGIAVVTIVRLLKRK